MSNYQRNGQVYDRRDEFRHEYDYSIQAKFNKEWITRGVDEDCITLCEELAKSMVDKKVSSSFLRNVFGEMRRIEAGGFENHRADFTLLRPKLAYTCGRYIEKDKSVKGVLNALQELYKLAAQNVTDAQSFNNVVSIMEAIVAFHKANGGSSK
jgi:CRISPR-associated protein Csm2